MGPDWKDSLAKLASLMPGSPETEIEPVASESETKKPGTLRIFMERKGHGGKTVTIVEGFECDYESLRELLSKIQKKLGIGGSARNGEILLQGDRRDKLRELLRNSGYIVKG